MIRDTALQDRPLSRPAHRSLRRWLIASVGALALLLPLGLSAHRWMSSDRSVEAGRLRIAEVRRGTLMRDLAADGRVTAASSPVLYAVADGVIELKVIAGDAVTRGQPLASLDSPALRSRLAQEQASLAALQAELGRAEMELAQGRASAQKLLDQAAIDHQAATRDLQRIHAARDAVPELDLLRAQDGLRKAEVALAHARADSQLQTRRLRFELRTRRLGIERQRAVVQELSRQVESLVVRSPVSGHVGQVMVAQRASVTTGSPLLSVVDLTSFELEIKVPDGFARDLAIGMPAEIRAGAANFAGRVRAVSPEVVNGEVASRLQFVGAQPAGLRQNQRLSARILLERKPGVLLVERGPFLTEEGGAVAYFVRDGIARRRPIRTGSVSLEAVEILSGAAPGDRIVVSGADSFGGAGRVRIAAE
jgi:HlyD family secretion protein